MQIIHFSDTHLGFNDLDILDDNNINQREADFYDAFSQVVSYIKNNKVDYIIHTGDLFHRSSPSNRAITFALKAIKEINDLNIPFILIAGNHSTPKSNLSSPILKIFESFSNVYLSYNQEYKKIEFKDAIFHTLPHMNDSSKAEEQIQKSFDNINKNKKNIMMLHCSVGAWYLMDEYGEWVYPKEKEYIFNHMDYVALGHWHGFNSVAINAGKEKYKNVYYSGSLERTSLNDKRNSKGFIHLYLEDNKEIQVTYQEIKIRALVQKEIDAQDYETSCSALNVSDCKDALVEVVLKNLSINKSLDIQNADIKALFKDALHVSIKREFLKTQEDKNEVLDIEALSLEEYFLAHMQEEENKEEYSRLKNKVQELFSLYKDKNDTA